MNIKELINIYQGTVEDKFEAGVVRDIYEGVLEDLKQLDEFAKLTKVEIPQCAIDEIEGAKKQGYSLFKAMNINDKSGEFRDWIELPANQELFARAWIEGYKVEEEKEKRYFVKLKATNQYLHVDNFSKASFLPLSISSFGTEVTKTMLDNLGLSEVFSSPLFEVEEIKTKS